MEITFKAMQNLVMFWYVLEGNKISSTLEGFNALLNIITSNDFQHGCDICE